MRMKVLLIVLCLGLSGEIFAKGPRGGQCDGQGQGQGQGKSWGNGGKGMMQARIKELNLTKEQEEAFMALKNSQREEMKALREKKKSLQKEFRDLLQQGNSAQAESKIAELTEVYGSTLKMRVKHFQKLRSLLTPEQVKKLQEERDSEE